MLNLTRFSWLLEEKFGFGNEKIQPKQMRDSLEAAATAVQGNRRSRFHNVVAASIHIIGESLPI